MLRYEDANLGESYLVIEAPVNGVFSGKGDNEPASGLSGFEIAANSSEMFTVVFRGSKGPADTKDRGRDPLSR